MANNIPSDKELFPRLVESCTTVKSMEYREAVRENLNRLTRETSEKILEYGIAGA